MTAPQTSTLKASARRVQDYLAGRGYDFTVRELPDSTRTAQDAAQSIGCTVAQIAKSLVFRNASTDEPVLVIASGSNKVATVKIERLTGLKLAKADASYVKNQLGFAIGGVPPVAHAKEIITLLDQDLKNQATVWAAAGTPNAVFALTPNDLELLTAGRWLDCAGD